MTVVNWFSATNIYDLGNFKINDECMNGLFGREFIHDEKVLMNRNNSWFTVWVYF